MLFNKVQSYPPGSVVRGRLRRSLLMLGLVGTLLGPACAPQPEAPLPALPATVALPEPARSLQGKVEFPPLEGLDIAQLPPELLQQSTVALLDRNTGTTLATGLTDGAGNFTFQPTPELTLAQGQVFYLEAIRGLKNNAVGGAAARLRTFLQWTPQGWVSLTGRALILNPATTSVAIIQGIKQMPIDNFFSAINPTIDPVTSAFNAGLTGIDPTFAAQYGKVLAYANEILTADRDPITHIKFDNEGLYYYKTIVSLPGLAGKVQTIAGGKVHRDAIGPAASFFFPRGLDVDAAGNTVYVADYHNNRVRKIDVATAQVTTLAGSGQYGFADGPAATARFYEVPDVCHDAARNKVYATDFHSHRVREIDAATGTVSTLVGTGGGQLVDGIGAAARFYYPTGCAFDDDRYLYIADTYNHAIRRVDVTTREVFTLAGGSTGLVDGLAGAASFYYPEDVDIDVANKRLYVADRANHAIRMIDVDSASPQFQEVTTVAGGDVNAQGFGVAGSSNGIGAAAHFNEPYGLAFDKDRNRLYVADYSNRRIRKVELATGETSEMIGPGFTGAQDGPHAQAGYNNAIRLALQGNKLYFADYANHAIRWVDVSDPAMTVTTLAGTLHLDGTGTDTRFVDITALAGPVKEGDRYLYIAEIYNHLISRLDLQTGQVQAIAGKKGYPGYADGIGDQALFNDPYRMVYDGVQFLYVADRGNNSIRKIDVFSFLVTTLDGGPSAPSTGDGPSAGMRFVSPAGIAYDKAGQKIYVMEDTRLRELDLLTRVVTTRAGAASGGLVDGTLAAARFNNAFSLVYLGKGRFFTLQGQQLREIDLTKDKVETVSGNTGVGFADGNGTNVYFYNPRDIVSDGVGNLFIADFYNHRVRKYEIATKEVTTVLGGGTGTPHQNGGGTSARFFYPYALHYDRLGRKLYLAEHWNGAWHLNGYTYGGNTIRLVE